LNAGSLALKVSGHEFPPGMHAGNAWISTFRTIEIIFEIPFHLEEPLYSRVLKINKAQRKGEKV